MAAYDTFVTFNDSLTQQELAGVKELTSSRRDELLGARSEDARIRLVSSYIEEVKEWLKGGGR
jgi:hypothetical protein